MKKSKRIAILALLLALTVILSLIPVRVSSATLALTLLPVFVIALTRDVVTGLLGGLVMGLTSLVMAFTLNAGSPTSPIFQNPLVSVLPRLFVPLVVFGVMKGFSSVALRIRAKRAEKGLASDDESEEKSICWTKMILLSGRSIFTCRSRPARYPCVIFRDIKGTCVVSCRDYLRN